MTIEIIRAVAAGAIGISAIIAAVHARGDKAFGMWLIALFALLSLGA